MKRCAVINSSSWSKLSNKERLLPTGDGGTHRFPTLSRTKNLLDRRLKNEFPFNGTTNPSLSNEKANLYDLSHLQTSQKSLEQICKDFSPSKTIHWKSEEQLHSSEQWNSFQQSIEKNHRIGKEMKMSLVTEIDHRTSSLSCAQPRDTLFIFITKKNEWKFRDISRKNLEVGVVCLLVSVSALSLVNCQCSFTLSRNFSLKQMSNCANSSEEKTLCSESVCWRKFSEKDLCKLSYEIRN